MNQPALKEDMSDIHVTNLTKTYLIHKKEPGLAGSLKSLFARKYEKVAAINNVSFNIKQGELVGFIGPNGAGKTTTLKCLSGLLYPTSGEVSVLGYHPWDRQAAYQKQFALVMGQKNQLWWDLPAMETFLLNKEIYEIPNTQFKHTLDKLMNLLEVNDCVNIQVRKLSLGQRMKCELIAALLHNPKVLFLDEPTIGLDVTMQKVIREFIKAYNTEFNATIILTSHYMDDVKELCQRVIMIDHGQIIFDGKLQQVIDKYAQNKLLTVTFGRDLSLAEVQKIGTIKEYSAPVAKIAVPRQEAVKLAVKVLKEYPIADITIEEPPIEAIIRRVFNTQKQPT